MIEYNILMDQAFRDVVTNILPCLTGLGVTLTLGASCVVRRKFSASLYFEDCAKHGATVAQYIGKSART
jgi:hypothetical protein